ncbi:hypothetical protein [Azospirillum sp.]|uniref:hypothetical protein n=1 Tax=Azospirillum sp. TaxID=34012 RepID=UPI002D4646B0|nr:hypothetical protein [Azospirillum sp.]HYD68326.1 hypothetical protein [Azospirillum sp.]
MSTITQMGNYARYLGLVRNLSAGQNSVDELSRQMTTGKKSVDLAAYGPETQKLLDLRAELVKRTNYVQSIDTALPRVKATDVAMTQLEKLAGDWQSSNLMPFQPGPASVTSPYNDNANGMQLRVNQDISKFTVGAQYTVTAIPSATGMNGSYDITVTDGLGGRTMRTINLKTVPPTQDGGYNFEISGGPGAGAVLNLSFDKLEASGNSRFTVTWPNADQMRDRVEGALTSVRQLLNERFGDRFLFSGSRFGTEPVGDLLATKQHSVVTLNGYNTNTEDYFEVSIAGQTFSYQALSGNSYQLRANGVLTTYTDNGATHDVTVNDGVTTTTTTVASPLSPAMRNTVTFVAQTLTKHINASATPALPMTVTTANGMIHAIANEQGKPFDISARVVNGATVDNTVNVPVRAQDAGPRPGDPLAIPPIPPTPAQPQIDRITLNGVNVDIGDTFEFSVEVGDPDDPYNQKYYNQYPNEPKDLPPYQKYTYKYTVTAADFAGGTNTVTAVAAKLQTQFNTQTPTPPVTLSNSGGILTLTSTNTLSTAHPNYTTLFNSSARVIDSSVNNSVTVSTLPPEANALTDVPYQGPPNLPFYDTEFLTKKTNAKAWEKSKVTADDGLGLDYGVVSTDPAFQTLVEAFRMARVASTNPGKWEEYVTKSRELMSQAKDMMRNVHAGVASDMATMQQSLDSHKDAMATVTERIASIEGIDQTEVAARLRASMNALEAAYTVAGQTQKMSLINYIA